MALQAKAVAAKGIGFNHLRAGLQVFLMYRVNELWLRHIQLVVRSVYEYAFRVQQGAHGAIAQYRRGLQAGEQTIGHLVENTAGTRVLHRASGPLTSKYSGHPLL